MSHIVNHHIATYHILHDLFIINPPRAAHEQREKINLSFYFHTSLWYLKRFYEGQRFYEGL